MQTEASLLDDSAPSSRDDPTAQEPEGEGEEENVSGQVLYELVSVSVVPNRIENSLARFEGELNENSDDVYKEEEEEEFTSRSSTPLVTATESRPASPVALSSSPTPGIMTPKKTVTSLSCPPPTLHIPLSDNSQSAQSAGPGHIYSPIPIRTAPALAPVPISSSSPSLADKSSEEPLASPPRSKSVSPNRPTGAPPSHSSPRKQGK
jgi:hypothetical protein